MAKRKIDLLNHKQKDDYSKRRIRREVQEATQQSLKRIVSNFLSLFDSNSLNSVHENVPSGKKKYYLNVKMKTQFIMMLKTQKILLKKMKILMSKKP